MSIVLAILVFSLVVIVHEWGHFYAARKCGILVEEFAIGMGPKLFSIKPGETVYSIRLFPIGGSCRMLGEEEAADDERAYNSKPIWKRMIVILAGVVMNLVLAFIIALGFVLFNGFQEAVPIRIVEDSPAQEAGLMVNDRIVRANGKAIRTYNDFVFFMALDANGSPIKLEVIRNGERVELTIAPVLTEEGYKLGFNAGGKFGIFADKGENPNNLQTAGVVESLSVSVSNVSGYVKSVVVGISGLFTKQVTMDDMAGPIGIVSIIDESYQESAPYGISAVLWTMLNLAALISANLAVMNLLPLPVLDGGRMVFLTVEAIRRKPVDPEKEGMLQMASFVLLMILAVIIAYNDILKMI